MRPVEAEVDVKVDFSLTLVVSDDERDSVAVGFGGLVLVEVVALKKSDTSNEEDSGALTLLEALEILPVPVPVPVAEVP